MEKYLINGWRQLGGGDLQPIQTEFFDGKIESSQDFEKIFETGKKIIKEELRNISVYPIESIKGIQLWRQCGKAWSQIELD